MTRFIVLVLMCSTSAVVAAEPGSASDGGSLAYHRDFDQRLQSREATQATPECETRLFRSSPGLAPSESEISGALVETETRLKTRGLSAKAATAAAILSVLVAADVTVFSYLNAYIPSQILPAAQSLTAIANIVGGFLLTRYYVPLGAKMGLFSWRLGEDQPLAPNHDAHVQTFQRGQVLRDARAQKARELILGYIGATRMNFGEAFNKYPENKLFVANVIADAAIQMRTLATELAPDDWNVQGAARRVFVDSLTEKPDAEFKKYVLERVQVYVREARVKDSAEYKYYNSVLSAWLD